MRRNHGQLQISASRRAFTLVELLVVCTIIGILVALTFFAVHKASVSAKIAKTRATIQKIDVAIQQIFEYDDRFTVFKNRYPELSDEERLKIAVHFVRDTMRMEMPQNWAEVEMYDSVNPHNPLLSPCEITLGGKSYAVEKSPLPHYYRQMYDQAEKTPSRAALLFLIIQNLNPEALEAFHGSEVADTDGDGLLEFVDAWGKPIHFLRWAPAFSDSELQPNVSALCDPKYVPQKNMDANRNWWNPTNNAQLKGGMDKASKDHPYLLGEESSDIGWFLYPLIYSAGPDGVYGIDEGDDSWVQNGEIDPYTFPFGMPNGSSHFDNIHNHQWYRSF